MIINRRNFLRQATLGVGAATISASFAQTAKTRWPIGCFNRPWTKWGIDAALDGCKAAGYEIFGLLSRTKTEPLIASDVTPEYLQGLKEKIAARGLRANLGAIRIRLDGTLEEAIGDLRKQVDHAQGLGLKYLMSFGVDRPKDQERFFQVMADAAAYSEPKQIKLVLKPHGGSSGASDEILRSIKEVNHPNFSIWYDAGNIIYYTGKDPVTELEPIAKYVTGFCAKDCAQVKGDVMIQLGTGKVDFKRVFQTLKKAGFNGPIMLEGSNPGQTPAEATANARANREFLEKTLASLD